jgi:hypothetical protein
MHGSWHVSFCSRVAAGNTPRPVSAHMYQSTRLTYSAMTVGVSCRAGSTMAQRSLACPASRQPGFGHWRDCGSTQCDVLRESSWPTGCAAASMSMPASSSGGAGSTYGSRKGQGDHLGAISS